MRCAVEVTIVTRPNCLFQKALLMLCAALAPLASARPQERDVPGKPIGKISVLGSLILLELDEGALGQQNLFDLGQHTLRFTPGSAGYRIENLRLRWDGEFGEQLNGPQVTLHNFSFPFSGKTWNSFSVGVTGSLRFTPENGAPADGAASGFGPRDEGGGSLGRLDPVTERAPTLDNTLPAICVFFQPRTSGPPLLKGLQASRPLRQPIQAAHWN